MHAKTTVTLLLLTTCMGCILGAAVTYTGPLVDKYCWDLPNHIGLDGANLQSAPLDHTVHCLRDIQACIDGGYVLMEQQSDGLYTVKYTLDAAGNERVTKILDTTASTKAFQVTASGEVDSNGVMAVTCLQETVGGAGGTNCTRDGQADPISAGQRTSADLFAGHLLLVVGTTLAVLAVM